MASSSFRAFQAVTKGEPARGVTTMTAADLPDGALIEVHWSSVNYKDALASTPTGRVARISPIVPGVDLAGVLLEDAGDVPAGTEVLAHGYEIGVSHHGGFAEYASVRRPSSPQAMPHRGRGHERFLRRHCRRRQIARARQALTHQVRV